MERSFCECDLSFVKSVRGVDPVNANYDVSKCAKGSMGSIVKRSVTGDYMIPLITGAGGNADCCESSTGLFQHYNLNYYECCTGIGVVDIGGCE